MRDSLKSAVRWLSTSWFWPLVLLVLPNCGLSSDGLPLTEQLNPGPEPRTTAVMCDIPRVHGEGTGPCATQGDVDSGNGISLTEAATALATGRKSSVGMGLDYSPTMLNACLDLPGKTVFYGPYPDGLTVCLNCETQIPVFHADPTAVCIAKCKDLLNFGGGPAPDEGVTSYCEANARVSTNFKKDECYADFCSAAGTPISNPVDPRRTPENMSWADQIGTDNQFGSNFLTRIAATTGPDTIDFNAGAASGELITTGDAWVEFGAPPGATETTLSHVLGVRESCPKISDCPDTDPSLGDIGFAISLNSDGQVYVIESGPALAVFGPFGAPYTGVDRFRVKITDRHDGTATISYVRLVGPCTPGTECAEDEFYTHVGAGPQYPLRVNASFREHGATIANVTIVRIIEQ